MKPKYCNQCCYRSELRQTGWGGPDHPEWYCPSCKVNYWVNKDGKLTPIDPDPPKNLPENWKLPVKKGKQLGEWTLQKGYWRKVGKKP